MSDSPRTRVAAVLASADLEPLGRPRAAGAGRRNDVWFVSTAAGEVVVRLLADDRRLSMERGLLERAAAAGVPVAACRWVQHAPFPAMVQDRLPGERLDTAGGSEALLGDLARVLRRVHAIPVAGGFGNLDTDQRGTADDLPSWFTGRVEVELDRAPLAAADAALVARSRSRLRDAEPLLRRQPAGLVHGDVQPSNLLVAGDHITGLLDWEAAKSGPPAFDFGWWDWWSSVFGTPWTTDALIDAYDPERRLDRHELAELRALVQVRIWARELAAGAAGGDERRTLAARGGLGALV